MESRERTVIATTTLLSSLAFYWYAKANGKFNINSGWSGRVAFTWQEALDITNPSSSEYKNEIPYTPNYSGSAMVVYNLKQWSTGYSILFSGKRYSLG